MRELPFKGQKLQSVVWRWVAICLDGSGWKKEWGRAKEGEQERQEGYGEERERQMQYKISPVFWPMVQWCLCGKQHAVAMKSLKRTRCFCTPKVLINLQYLWSFSGICDSNNTAKGNATSVICPVEKKRLLLEQNRNLGMPQKKANHKQLNYVLIFHKTEMHTLD